MAMNGSGIRDTARVLRIGPTTVMRIKEKPPRCNTSTPRWYSLLVHAPSASPSARAAELDEMWSFVGTREKARWLWHAIDHHTGRVLAYVVGTRKDTEFLRLRGLLDSRWPRPVLHRQGGRLSAASPTRAAHGRQTVDAKD